MRQTVKELLEWGKMHHYPQLVLSDTDYVKHGELHWYRMARNRERRALAWKRALMWDEYSHRKAS